MRQDIAFHPGEAVAQKIVGNLLARYFDALITVDPHCTGSTVWTRPRH
jgi:ribose-phosphate pyrophosphokinase